MIPMKNSNSTLLWRFSFNITSQVMFSLNYPLSNRGKSISSCRTQSLSSQDIGENNTNPWYWNEFFQTQTHAPRKKINKNVCFRSMTLECLINGCLIMTRFAETDWGEKKQFKTKMLWHDPKRTQTNNKEKVKKGKIHSIHIMCKYTYVYLWYISICIGSNYILKKFSIPS